MENDASQLPLPTVLLVADEFIAPSDNIDSLSQHVTEIQHTLEVAEAHLRSLEAESLKLQDEPAQYIQSLHLLYCRLPERLDAYSKIYHIWEAAEVSVFEKSEARFSLGQIRRLHVVAKNIQRISAHELGVPDPEMQQTMLEMQLIGAGKMRFDD